MPRYNTDGRTAKFIHSGGGRGGGFQGGGKKFNNDFKFTSQQHRSIQRKHRGPKPFQRLDEAGDVIMGAEAHASGSGQGGRGQFQGNSKKWRKRGRDGRGNRNFKQNEFVFGPAWHKITIPDGTSYNRDMVISSLISMSRTPFVPVAYSVVGTNTVFYVEDRSMAQALAECSGKIDVLDNRKLILRIHPCPYPAIANFDAACESKVKIELERRYNGQVQTLSLSNFVMSPDLIREYFLPLSRASVVMKLLSLVDPLLTTLVGLDLSNNKLATLEGFGTLPKKAPSLRALNLGKNKFRDMFPLDKLHGMPIVELILEENPVCNGYDDKDKYISDVRKRFPKVTKLDGVDIPPPITFDVAEPVKMPDVKGSSFCNEEAKKVVLAFWEQYVSIYDSDDRKPLVAAYHETATTSMVASYSQQGHVSQMDPSKKLSGYLGDSRNLLRNPDKMRKYKLLYQGKQEIVEFLRRLPKTIHDPASTVIDMPVAVENFILFNVVGLFKEREERNQPVRYFSRTFAVVPLNGGFVIANELLYITTSTTEQYKGAFKSPPAATVVGGPEPGVSAATINIAPVASTSSAAPAVVTEEQRRIMLASFAQQSGMNEDWSRKCLEENDWDFNRSAYVFSQLKEHGKIPPEAFVK